MKLSLYSLGDVILDYVRLTSTASEAKKATSLTLPKKSDYIEISVYNLKNVLERETNVINHYKMTVKKH